MSTGKLSAVILPHPVLIERFRNKVAALRTSLDNDSVRSEAAAVLSTLIESVMIYPDEPDGPEAEVVAKVADLLIWATNDNAAPKGGVCSSTALVAGTAPIGIPTRPYELAKSVNCAGHLKEYPRRYPRPAKDAVRRSGTAMIRSDAGATAIICDSDRHG